ncbi:MAG: T9SS type A sorting domain-containing protein [Bacteroidetes bacterium]|nr:T9SS type A sorting domain-containing protein [Bacteroidota bacterium]
MSLPAVANPGDTTWVTVFNTRKLTHYGNYDTTAVFPTGKRYRKIRLHYILGRYACPANAQYCGSWDYTTNLYVLPPNADTVEIARVITPYATDWLGQNKKHEYIMDVTDYASVLEGINDFRFEYQGYSWGFTLTLKLEFIEGIPPMDALSVKNVYNGYFCYGASASSTNTNCYIENNLSPKTFTSFVAPVSNVYLRNTISGHGADATNCAEFCSKYYNLNIDGNHISQVQLWKPNCGWNQEYAQTGTWLYNRANWCPGEVVYPIFHDITSLINTNATYTLDIDMQPYSVSNPSAGWNWTTQMINYSAVNHTLDASIEHIVSPTTADDYRRENPNCANPVIKLRNTGSTPITEVVFNYGLRGKTPDTFTWLSDGLGFLRDTLVVFPSMSTPALSSSLSGNYFDVSIVSVNNVTDDNPYNNIYASKVPPTTAFPNQIKIGLHKSGSTSIAENVWVLYDEWGNGLISGNGSDSFLGITDTISLEPGCYKIDILNSQCRGLRYPNPSTGSWITVGSFKVYRANGTSVVYDFPIDFGCGFTKYFYIAAPDDGGGDGDGGGDEDDDDVSLATNNLNPNAFQIFPNPANNNARLKFNLNGNHTLTYKITDISGRLVQQKQLTNISTNSETIDLNNIESGVYFVSVQLEDNSTITKKLVIQK